MLHRLDALKIPCYYMIDVQLCAFDQLHLFDALKIPCYSTS